MEDPRQWIRCDETAAEALARAAVARPPILLPPPLHRVPLRAGAVVEVVGPSPSAKSELLLQASISCILPVEWNGLPLGGMGRLVLYFDLDCRFDVLRLARCLRHRLAQATGARRPPATLSGEMNEEVSVDEELFQSCMGRFFYMRCYSSLEFLAALKTVPRQIHKETEALGTSPRFLLIDSIGAFYWMDRDHQPLASTDHHRKNLSLQSITEAIVRDINKLLTANSMLVLATKSTIFGHESSQSEAQKAIGTSLSEYMLDPMVQMKEREKHLYREYMPSAWQLFVTHRVFLSVSEERLTGNENQIHPVYTSVWVIPKMNIVDKFIVNRAGICMRP